MSAQSADRTAYLPPAKPLPVVEAGEFGFAAAYLDHGHIYGQVGGLCEAGAELRWIYDPDPQKAAALQAKHPGARLAREFDEILDDAQVRLVTAAAVTCERGEIGCRVMAAGKDYFTDKAPFASLEQLGQARQAVASTGRKYAVYYSERLHTESGVFAGDLIAQGAIGRVIQVLGLGPHRLNAPSRPGWFFERAKYGGILCDIGSHQAEQFLFYSGAQDATVTQSLVANYQHPAYPELEDFGEMSLVGDNGTSGYHRVDWFTPDGLRTWGDGRTFILGTDGYIELRKFIDVGAGGELTTDHVFLVNGRGEQRFHVAGKVGFPFFGQLILDCLDRTENAMTQAHAFKAAEISLRAQQQARRIESSLA